MSLKRIFLVGFCCWVVCCSLAAIALAENATFDTAVGGLQQPGIESDFDPELEETAAETEPVLPESLAPVWYFFSEWKSLRADHPLNPQSALIDFSKRKTATTIDLDWDPHLSETLTFRTRLAGQYRLEDDEASTHGYWLEGYLQWQNQQQTVVLDLGKVKTEWGSGYAWNPTQVLIPLQRDVSDDIEEEEGVEMAKLELVTGLVTSTFVLARLNREIDLEEQPYQAAVKGSFNFEPWEFSLIHHQATQFGWNNGLSFTGLVSDALELHGEWTRSERRNRATICKAAAGIQMGPTYLPARYEYCQDTRTREYDRILIGGQVTFAGTMNLIFELYTTTHGYDDQEWKLVKEGVAEALRENAWQNPDYPFTTPQGNPYAGFLKSTLAAVADEELRQHYLFLRYVSGESDNHWEWEQILLLNLDDSSQLHQSFLHKTWADLVNTSLGLTLFRGDEFTEFALNPYQETVELNVEIRF